MADVVLIDSPPLLAAGDVFDVLPIVDTVLLVVRSGKLTDVAARRVAELLGRFEVPISGVVLVGAKGRRADGYGYGYGASKKQKRGRASAAAADVSYRQKAERVASPPLTADDDPAGWPFAVSPDSSSDAQFPSRRARRTSPSA